MAKYIANSFEENGYHDSYFYHVIFDTSDNSISTHTYASTAFGVSPEQFSDCSPLPEELKSSYTQAVKEKALLIINEHQDTIVGDTVEVVAGRKFSKGSIATVQGFRDYRDRYGRVQTRYAETDIGSIPLQNVKTISRNPTEKTINCVYEQVFFYGYVRFNNIFKV